MTKQFLTRWPALAALPFVRFVQMARGNRTAILYDSQVRAFLAIIVILVVVTVSILVTVFPHHPEQAIREALFNITSIMTGTWSLGFSQPRTSRRMRLEWPALEMSGVAQT